MQEIRWEHLFSTCASNPSSAGWYCYLDLVVSLEYQVLDTVNYSQLEGVFVHKKKGCFAIRFNRKGVKPWELYSTEVPKVTKRDHILDCQTHLSPNPKPYTWLRCQTWLTLTIYLTEPLKVPILSCNPLWWIYQWGWIFSLQVVRSLVERATKRGCQVAVGFEAGAAEFDCDFAAAVEHRS